MEQGTVLQVVTGPGAHFGGIPAGRHAADGATRGQDGGSASGRARCNAAPAKHLASRFVCTQSAIAWLGGLYLQRKPNATAGPGPFSPNCSGDLIHLRAGVAASLQPRPQQFNTYLSPDQTDPQQNGHKQMKMLLKL